jgi:5-methylcytosine-specific restriction protein A
MPNRPPVHKPYVGRKRPHLVEAAAIRLSPCKRGYDRRWQRLRLVVLAEEPLCRFCYAEGRLTPATDVDHIEPLRTRPDLRLLRSNLRSLCHPCHARHTASQQQRCSSPHGA